MGHVVKYTHYEYTKDVKKDIARVLEVLDRIAYDPQESSGYHGNMTFHDGKVYDNEAEAMEAIGSYDDGWYSDHAVLFKDCAAVKKTAAMRKKDEQIAAAREKACEINEKYRLPSGSTAYIGCKECGSKISRKHLRSCNCPVCGKDLRSNTDIARVEAALKRIQKLVDEYNEMEKKLKDKAPIRWLVKYEYHC